MPDYKEKAREIARDPIWIIRPDARGGIHIWLGGGCINSLERLSEAEEFLRCMRPLFRDNTSPRAILSEQGDV